jgi:hypothetical protein
MPVETRAQRKKREASAVEQKANEVVESRLFSLGDGPLESIIEYSMSLQIHTNRNFWRSLKEERHKYVVKLVYKAMHKIYSRVK